MRFDKAGEVFPRGDRDLWGGRSDVSYDLTIAKDEMFSAWTRLSDLADFLRVAEHVKSPTDNEGLSSSQAPIAYRGFAGPYLKTVRL
jgi:hypothetical protein